jgi:hypothetical protein
MTIRIESKPLAGMLTDLERTASRGGYPSDGVLLHSAVGPIGDEPGQQSLLVGTSYGRGGIGYCIEAAHGQMEPMLWPITDVDIVLGFLKKTGGGKKDHAVLIDREGDEVCVAEDPDLFADGTSIRFTVAPLSSFSQRVWASLDFDPDQAQERDDYGVRVDIPAANMAVFQRIAARRGQAVKTFVHDLTEQRSKVMVQIGPTYRGAVGTWPWDRDIEGDGGTGPDVDLYVPNLPVADDDNRPDRVLRDAASMVIQYQLARPEILQKKLKVSEARARLLLQQLEERNVVASPVGSSTVRDVIISMGGRDAVLNKIADELAAAYDRDDDPLANVGGAAHARTEDDEVEGQGDLLADDVESDEDGDAT